jgi:hypothetical protein
VNFPGNSLFCEGNTGSATISHAVTLGVYCEQDGDSYYFSGDLFFECANSSSGLDFLYNEYGFSGLRYLCSESAVFGSGSSSAFTQVLPSVAIVTDTYWLTSADAACFKIDSGPRSPTAPTPPLPAPQSSAPITPSPTLGSTFPTIIPTMSQAVAPSKVEPAVVTKAPIGTRGNLPTFVPLERPSGSTSSAITARGASVGAVFACIAIGFAVFF